MNILHLKYAVEIAKTNSISQAAENLFMGQPNLSRAIKELEESLGITIFKRTSKGISVTADGAQFLQYAQRILAQIDEVEQLYTNKGKVKTTLSVCVPRASYIAYAFTEFAKSLEDQKPFDLHYKETSNLKAINNVVKGDCNLSIIRYQQIFDSYFESLFKEKKLNSEIITSFKYELVFHKSSPLAQLKEITTKDLEGYTEISHPDGYVPSMPSNDLLKEGLSKYAENHIYVYERGSQFQLLENVPKTFMWVSAIDDEWMNKFGLVRGNCTDNDKTFIDVLVSRKDYKLTSADSAFITEIVQAKRKFIG